MKFSILSDIHNTPDKVLFYYKGQNKKLGHRAEALLAQFIDEMNSSYQPDFTIQLGDVIEAYEPFSSRKGYQKVCQMLDELDSPVYHVIGNHEQKHIELDELLSFTGQTCPYYSFDRDGYHFVVLYAEPYGHTMRICESQLDWLEEDLQQTELPTFVFSHQSLADPDLKGNFWFEEDPQACLVDNREEVRWILAASGKVLVVFNGHLHWNSLDEHDGIPYISLQSLVENVNNDGVAANAHAEVEVSDKGIEVVMRGVGGRRFFITEAQLVDGGNVNMCEYAG